MDDFTDFVRRLERKGKASSYIARFEKNPQLVARLQRRERQVESEREGRVRGADHKPYLVKESSAKRSLTESLGWQRSGAGSQ